MDFDRLTEIQQLALLTPHLAAGLQKEASFRNLSFSGVAQLPELLATYCPGSPTAWAVEGPLGTDCFHLGSCLVAVATGLPRSS